MKLKAPLAILLLVGSLHTYTQVQADDDRRQKNGGEEQRRGGGRPNLAPRQAPPKFASHPQGQHPHGPIVRPHPIRVLQPRVVQYGGHDWHHWEHPEFSRPAYYWDWNAIHNVSCVAEDSYGDQYPVTEPTFPGFTVINMTAMEDDALDRCYGESGNDPSCYLVSCSHF